MANNSFTFWSNMKEAIDVFDKVELKYKLYDALTEFALYGVKPDNDGSDDYQIIMMFLQSMIPSLSKSSNFHKNAGEVGAIGGSNQKYSDSQFYEAIKYAAKVKGKVPDKKEIVKAFEEIYGNAPTDKTVGRRVPQDEITRIALEELNSNNENNQRFNF